MTDDGRKQIRTTECVRCSGSGMCRSSSVDDMGGDYCPTCGGSGRLPVYADQTAESLIKVLKMGPPIDPSL